MPGRFTGLPQDEGDFEPEDPDAARDRTRSRDDGDEELAEQRAERRYERYLGL